MANTELFKKIRDQIKSDPKTFYMNEWEFDMPAFVESGGDWDHSFYDPDSESYDSAPASECGTARCVAGWAVHFEAERLGINVNRPLRYVMRDLAKRMGLGHHYDTVGKAVLEIDDTSLFWEAEEKAYEIVNEYAEGLRD